MTLTWNPIRSCSEPPTRPAKVKPMIVNTARETIPYVQLFFERHTLDQRENELRYTSRSTSKSTTTSSAKAYILQNT